MILLITIFVIFLSTIAIIYFFTRPSKTSLPSVQPPPEEKKTTLPEKKGPSKEKKEPESKPKPEAKTKAATSRLVPVSKLMGFGSDIVDFSMLYDSEHRILLAIAEVRVVGL